MSGISTFGRVHSLVVCFTTADRAKPSLKLFIVATRIARASSSFIHLRFPVLGSYSDEMCNFTRLISISTYSLSQYVKILFAHN